MISYECFSTNVLFENIVKSLKIILDSERTLMFYLYRYAVLSRKLYQKLYTASLRIRTLSQILVLKGRFSNLTIVFLKNARDKLRKKKSTNLRYRTVAIFFFNITNINAYNLINKTELCKESSLE